MGSGMCSHLDYKITHLKQNNKIIHNGNTSGNSTLQTSSEDEEVFLLDKYLKLLTESKALIFMGLKTPDIMATRRCYKAQGKANKAADFRKSRLWSGRGWE